MKTTKTTLRQFLMDKKIIHLARHYYELSDKGRSFDAAIDDGDNRIIRLFSWSDASEGIEYWSKLHYEYVKIREDEDMPKKPICHIINGKFSWILKVDNKEIHFQNWESADYFEKHYGDLGYEVFIYVEE